AALTLSVLNGGPSPDVLPPRPLGDFGRADLAKLRIGYYADDGTFSPSPAVRRAVERAATILRSAGATVTPWTPPDPGRALELFMRLLTADGFRGATRALGNGKRDPRIKFFELAASLPTRTFLRVVMALTGRRKAAAALPYFARSDADMYWQS